MINCPKINCKMKLCLKMIEDLGVGLSPTVRIILQGLQQFSNTIKF